MAAARSARQRAERAAQESEQRLEQLNTRRDTELERARQEARRMVETARAEAQRLMDELDELRRQKEAADFADRTRAAKSQLKSRLRRMEEAVDPVSSPADGEYVLPRPVLAGDRVQLMDMGLTAVVISGADDKGMVEVLSGAIRTRTPVSNLRLYESKREEKRGRGTPTGARAVGLPSRMERSVQTDLDVRGQTVEEALLEVDRFLDNAVLCGLERVTVIHGKGTGALRAAVHGHLKGHKQVKGFRLGAYGEGETGVTVIELR